MPQLVPQSPWAVASNRMWAEQAEREKIQRELDVEAEKRRQFEVNSVLNRDQLEQQRQQFEITKQNQLETIKAQQEVAAATRAFRDSQALQAERQWQLQRGAAQMLGMGGMFGDGSPGGGGGAASVPGGGGAESAIPGATGAQVTPRALGPLLSVAQSPRQSGPMAGTSMMPQAQELTRLQVLADQQPPSAAPQAGPTQIPVGRFSPVEGAGAAGAAPPAAAGQPPPGGLTLTPEQKKRLATKLAYNVDIPEHPDPTPFEIGWQQYLVDNNLSNQPNAANHFKAKDFLDYKKQFGQADDQPPVQRVQFDFPSGVFGNTTTGEVSPIMNKGKDGAPATPFGPRPDAKAQDDALAGMGSIEALDNIQSLYKRDYVGPSAYLYQGRQLLPEDMPFLSKLDPGRSEFFAAVAQNENLTKRLISGAAVVGNESIRLNKQIPLVTDNPTDFQSKMRQTRINQVMLLNRIARRFPQLAPQIQEILGQIQGTGGGGTGGAGGGGGNVISLEQLIRETEGRK